MNTDWVKPSLNNGNSPDSVNNDYIREVILREGVCRLITIQ